MRMKRIFPYLSFSLVVFILILVHHTFLVNRLDNIPVWSNNISRDLNSETRRIEVWSKASIGDYLWLHILGGVTENVSNGFFRVGTLHLLGVEFTFRSGPGYIQTTVPQDVTHLVLVINGRTTKNVLVSRQWLNYLPNLRKLTKVAVIILGNEECQNDWILPYMRSRGGVLDLVFLIYDSPLIDNKEIFQWPLGVAMYRGFPKIFPSERELELPRSFKCNFVGTVYENSSRRTLENILKSSEFQHNCYVSTRVKWLPNETKASLAKYVSAISNSDLTLSPVGKNAECYRIYEAMSFGSVPVVEDVTTKGKCSSPLRLLKKFNAPVIYTKDWKNLEQIFILEKNMTHNDIISRRKMIFHWYTHFKTNICSSFVNILKSRFYHG